MNVKHCDGCGTVIDTDEHFVIDIGFWNPDADKFESEKIRDVCFRCMVKIRPVLDVFDGKTDTAPAIGKDLTAESIGEHLESESRRQQVELGVEGLPQL